MNPYILNALIYFGLAVTALCIGAGLFAITEVISLRREAKRDREKFRRRFATGCRPFMVLLVLVGCSVARGQEEKKSICGTNLIGPNILSRHTELIQVTCPPWAALSAVGAVPVPAGKGPQTQVIVHAREGRTFIAEADGQQLAGVLYDLNFRPGFKGGIVVFEGAEFKSLKVSVQGDLP